MNTKFFALGAAALVLASDVALADHDLLSATETVYINARPKIVWHRMRDFNGLPQWHPAVAKSRIVNGDNNKPGAVRELAIKDGPIIYDELISLDDERMYYIYKLVDSPLPVTEYQSTLLVKPKGHGSEVIWTVTFRRKNPVANPPADQSDAAGIQLLEGVYRTGIDNLKILFDAR
jgi:mxaD protein